MLQGIPAKDRLHLRSKSEFDRSANGKLRIFKKKNLYNGPGCDGENEMIHLAWDPTPDTGSYALICIDLHPVANGWIHLYAPYLSIDRQNLNLDSTSSIVGLNSFGKRGYGGPCPPLGSGVHRYVFYLFALSRNITREKMEGEKEKCRGIEEFVQWVGRDNILAYGTFDAYYGR